MVEFKPVCDYAIEYIAANMRTADAVEVRASNNFSPLEALTESVKVSDFNTVVWIEGVPCSIFGLVKRDILSGSGVPWLLSADDILKHKRELLRQSPAIVDEMLNICPRLVNYVHAENKVSINWLRWLGFTIEQPAPYGIEGELFHRFHFER